MPIRKYAVSHQFVNNSLLHSAGQHINHILSQIAHILHFCLVTFLMHCVPEIL